MKKTILIVASLFALTAFAQDKGQPVYGKTTSNPVVVPVSEVKVSTPSKSKEPAVKNQKAPAKSADAKTTAK